MTDYYQLLGVSRRASAAEVRKAYAQLARERHPDRFSDPEEKARAHEAFKELTSAFNTLSNDRTRKQYDAELEQPRPTTPEELASEAFALAMQKLEAHDHQGAVESLRVAARHNPREPRYHAALARILGMDARSAREAVQSWERAIELAPLNATFHAQMARLLVSQGLTIRAQKLAEEALRLAPHDPEVRRAAAEAGLSGGTHEPSGGGLRGLLRRKP